MQRDLDLVREILKACEAESHGYAPHPLLIEGYSRDQIGFHVYLMIDAGLLEGGPVTNTSSQSPEGMAQSMTWAGYEFLEASRNNEIWGKAKKAAKATGGMTLEALKGILTALATEAAKKFLGLPPS